MFESVVVRCRFAGCECPNLNTWTIAYSLPCRTWTRARSLISDCSLALGHPRPVTGSIHSQLLCPDSILGEVLFVRHALCRTKTQGRHCSLLRADRVPRAKSRRGSRRTQMSQTESKKHEEPELWSATVRVRRRGCGWGLFPSQLHLCLVRPARVVATPAAWSRHLRRLRFPRFGTV